MIKEYHAYDVPYANVSIDALAVDPQQDMILTGLGAGLIDSSPEAKTWEKTYDRISVWKLSDGQHLTSFPDPGRQILQAAWDPRGRYVAFVDTDSLVLWHPAGSDANYIRFAYPYPAAALAITRDGGLIAVAAGNHVTVYNVKDNN
jgi:YD repeat-containing protein